MQIIQFTLKNTLRTKEHNTKGISNKSWGKTIEKSIFVMNENRRITQVIITRIPNLIL